MAKRKHRKPLMVRLPQEAVQAMQELRRSNATRWGKHRKDRANTERQAVNEARE
jgi:hypothetical protein